MTHPDRPLAVKLEETWKLDLVMREADEFESGTSTLEKTEKKQWTECARIVGETHWR